jgi:predicted enzyme related to lactoylglutathione lyase
MSKTNAPTNAAAWFEIGVKSLDKGAAFYGAVLATTLKRETMGPQEIAVFPREGGMSGNLYESAEVGAAAPVVHFNAPSPLEEALARVRTSGGDVVSQIHGTPDGGRFAYCRDPDGTRFGLYTPA